MFSVSLRWLLYYSASVCRCDSMRFALFMGVAASGSVEGPYERLHGKPLLGPDGPQTVGSGSFKMLNSMSGGEFTLIYIYII